MSSVVISGNTSGTITLDAPAVAGTTTLTLPATSGTVLTSASSIATSQLTGSISASSLPAGSILQVVNSAYTTGQTFSSVTSGTYTSTGLTASITPSSASNKILVMVSAMFQPFYSGGTNVPVSMRVIRGASTVIGGPSGAATVGTNCEVLAPTTSTNNLDSPATTSSVTYTVQIAPTGATVTMYFNRTYHISSGFESQITLMEVKV